MSCFRNKNQLIGLASLLQPYPFQSTIKKAGTHYRHRLNPLSLSAVRNLDNKAELGLAPQISAGRRAHSKAPAEASEGAHLLCVTERERSVTQLGAMPDK